MAPRFQCDAGECGSYEAGPGMPGSFMGGNRSARENILSWFYLDAVGKMARGVPVYSL